MLAERWFAAVAIVGAVASLLAGVLLWLVVIRPDSVAITLGVWLGR